MTADEFRSNFPGIAAIPCVDDLLVENATLRARVEGLEVSLSRFADVPMRLSDAVSHLHITKQIRLEHEREYEYQQGLQLAEQILDDLVASTPAGFKHRRVAWDGISAIQWRRCSCGVTVGAAGYRAVEKAWKEHLASTALAGGTAAQESAGLELSREEAGLVSLIFIRAEQAPGRHQRP